MTFSKLKNRAGSGAFLVASGILLSRIAGFARERVFAHYFGNSDAAGAFKAALRIPNFLQNLFGEGVLSASFIPVYARLVAEHDEETAGRVAGAVASLLALAVGIVVALGVSFTPLFVELVAPGFHGEVRELTIRIVRILFPGVGLLVMSAWCLGVLNSHKKFFLSYIAPVFWNLVVIATMIAWGARYAQFPLAIALAWGTVAGSALQFGIQLPFVLRRERSLRFSLGTALQPVRDIIRNLGPVVVSRGVVQLSAYIDAMIASFLGAGAVASIGYAQTIYLLPVSLFGMSVAAAELPGMSGALGTDQEIHSKLRNRLIAGKRKIAFFVIPSAAAFLFLGRYVVAGLFETGRFGPEDTRYVWYILIGSTAGLLAATWGRLYSSAFYALKDTRTTLRFAVIRVALTVILGVLFAFPLRPLLIAAMAQILRLPVPAIPNGEIGMGAMGLTLSAGIAGWIEFLLLRSALSKRIGPALVPMKLQLQLWACALAGVGVAIASAHLLLPMILRSIPAYHPVAGAVWICGVFGATYLGMSSALGVR